MRNGIIEIIGAALIVAGCAGLVAAASMVSIALAVTVAGFFVLVAGVVAVYVAALLDQAEKTPAKPGEHR